MKLAQTTNNFKSNMDNVKTQNFGIGDASVVIDILRNRLYKNKIQTLVQEYICNGRDAMREIDSKKDIQIIAPTRFSPTFKVRDFGPGITPDRMATVFVNYGSSTKRTNNKQTGGFGIGAKSAWSYTDSFTAITYIDGTKRTYVAHTGANNNGRLDLINTEETTELNGTEINIAVNSQDIGKFHSAINRCVYFWQDGYKVKGMELSHIHTKGEMFNNHLEIGIENRFPSNIADRYSNDIICTIDDIPYKLTSFRDKIDSLDKINRLTNGNFIIHIPNGLVEVSANREEISDSEHTIKYLTRLLDKTYQELDNKIKTHFKDITNPYDYITAFDSYKGKFNLESYRTFGDFYIGNNQTISSKLFEKVKFYKVHIDRKGKFVKNCVNNDSRSYSSKDKFDIALSQKNSLFYNIDESAVIVGKKLRKYLESHDNCILIENNGDDATFNSLIKDLDFKDLKTILLPAKVKTAKVKRTAKQFCIHSYKYYRKETFFTTIDDNRDEWYYIEMNGNSLPHDMWHSRIRTLESFFGVKICSLSQTNVKLVKNDKNFKPLNDLIKNFKPSKEQTGYVIKDNAKHLNIYRKLKGLIGIKDKNIQSLINLYNTIPKDLARLARDLPKEIADKVHNADCVLDFVKKDNSLDDVIKNYPLLEQINMYSIQDNPDDVVLYLNSKYKTLNKGGQ